MSLVCLDYTKDSRLYTASFISRTLPWKLDRSQLRPTRKRRRGIAV